MRCPTLAELPSPPSNRTGWPWTEESPQFPIFSSDDAEYPLISIVTANYNYGQFIEETIRSVLLQGYPNLEYIIIDGGSTDNSVEIIKKYENFLSIWVSEKDEGQSNGINKGFKKCTGEIVAFINSDDGYLPGALKFAADVLTDRTECDFVCAQTRFIDINSSATEGFEELFAVELNHRMMTEECHIAQPSTFFRSSVIKKIGLLSEKLNYCLDYDYWLRAFLSGCKFASSGEVISLFRLHQSSKTVGDYNKGKFTQDFITIYRHALVDKNITLLDRKGLYRGLGRAICLLFVNLESDPATFSDARKTLWANISRSPMVLIFPFVWKTFILSMIPNELRIVMRRLRSKSE
jgi:glycosyltransferase involved in cell wall biosynthesis